MKYLVLLVPLMTACTSYSPHNRQNYQMATVTQAQPVYRTIEIHKPRTVCEERQQIKRHADSAAPTIVGAVVGGVLGNTIARNSSNRGLGTAAGAVIGGAIGNDVAQKNGTDVMHHSTVCYESGSDVEYKSVIDGYQVTYLLNGREYKTIMDRDPGPQMPVYVEPGRLR